MLKYGVPLVVYTRLPPALSTLFLTAYIVSFLQACWGTVIVPKLNKELLKKSAPRLSGLTCDPCHMKEYQNLNYLRNLKVIPSFFGSN